MTDVAEQVPQHAVDAALNWFSSLTPSSLGAIGEVYASSAIFQDPFQRVQGIDSVRRVYAHMFEALESPRFVIRDCAHQNNHTFVTWDFEFALSVGRRRMAHTIHGSSHFQWVRDGAGWRLGAHRDYWDPAQEVYEKVPVLGGLMRWLKRKLATPAAKHRST